MITDEIRDAARSAKAGAEEEIARIDDAIRDLREKRHEQRRKLREADLIVQGIEPCRKCKRKVRHPCHTLGTFLSEGPWDGLCRSAFYPEPGER